MPVDNALAREQYERYAYARDSGHIQYIQKAEKCDNFFYGEQWDSAVENRLRRQGKPVLTINKTFATAVAIMGSYLENQVDVGFRPAKDGTDEVAQALSKVYLQISAENYLKWLRAEVAADGFITSRGFYDVRMRFDHQMRGYVDISLLNPKNVLPDADADSYDPDDWGEVFITKWLTPDEIELNYNKHDADILRQREFTEYMGFDTVDWTRDSFGMTHRYSVYRDPSAFKNRRIRLLERQFRELAMVPHFVDIATGDMTAVPADFDEEKIRRVMQYANAKSDNLTIVKRKAKRIRWCVTADNIVLHNEVSPYKHFTPVPYFPVFRRGRTLGFVEHWLSPQEQLNKAESQELHIINTTANSGWKLKTGSLQNMDVEELEERGAETGLVLELTEPNDAEKIQPNQVPTGIDRVSAKADNFIKEISGQGDSQRGLDRADVAAKAIMAKQAAGGVNLAWALFNLQRTDHLLTRNVLDLVQEYYTEERVLKITSNDLNPKSEQLTVNQVTPEGTVVNDLTLGRYEIVITNVPARDTFEETQFDEALKLREQGVAIPDEVLIKHSHLQDKGEIAQEIARRNGGGDPTQAQQQMQQLEVELKRTEVAERQARAEFSKAEAALNAARARKTAQEVMQGQDGQGGDPNEQLKLEQQHQKDMEELMQLQ